MKKLLALLVIIIFTTSILMAVDNPFDFSLYNQVTIKATDQSQPGRTQDADTSIGDSPTYDFVVTRQVLDEEMKCSASITIAEIYTLGSYLKGFFELGGTGGDSDRINFSTGLTNAIQVVPDYFKIDINVDWTTRWENNGYVDFLLTPSLKLSGGIPDSGFTWAVGEDVEMLWNPQNWKDSDPTFQSYDGDEYNPATGLAIHGDDGVFSYAEFKTNVTIEWEFFHFFAPENITCTLSLSHNLNVQLNYSYYLEEDKRLRNEGQYGVKFGLAGVDLGLYMYLRTQDYLNTSAPLNGDNGSNWLWGNLDETVTWDGTGITDFTDGDAVSHKRPTMRIGPRITFGYSKEWFSFGTKWTGYEANLRRYDELGTNRHIAWCNEFEIWAKFSL